MKYSLSRHFSDNWGRTPLLKNCIISIRTNLSFFRKHSSSTAGFTLVEVLVVTAIIGFLSTSLILNFSRSRINIEQNVNLVMATIREAQSKTVSSTVYNYPTGPGNPCGYGVHYVSATQLIIYVGPNAATADPSCATMDKRYNATRDSILITRTFIDSRVEMKNPFNDIFFLPPDPKTYLDNDASLNGWPISIQVGVAGEACSQNCRTISIDPSGKIEY